MLIFMLGLKFGYSCAKPWWEFLKLIDTNPYALYILLVQITAADYILKVGVSNFRNAWESLDSELERVDEYGLGVRESLQEAVQAVSTILGMQPCEVRMVCPVVT